MRHITVDLPRDEEQADGLSNNVIARQLAHVGVRARLQRQELTGWLELIRWSRHGPHRCPRRIRLGCEGVDRGPYSLSWCERQYIRVQAIKHVSIENLEDDIHVGSVVAPLRPTRYYLSCISSCFFE